jgi:transposase IS204/IS1001/IS1096/IS1165 family protein
MPNALPGKDLLPRSPLLRLTDIQHNGPNWTVMADGPPCAACPTCGRVSTSRHSAYVRTLKDLPAVGAVVGLKVRVSRWRCLAPACAVRLFADRLPGVADLRGRRTCRADVVARLIGYALGGRAGERLTMRIGLPVRLEFLVKRRPAAGRGLGSERPSARDSDRPFLSGVCQRRSTASGPPMSLLT